MTKHETQTTDQPRHTPGPWIVADDGKGYPYIGTPPKDTEHRADEAVAVEICATQANIGNSTVREMQAGAWANARLIAAAPDLEAALRAITAKAHSMNTRQHAGALLSPDDWAELYAYSNRARAALARAEGKGA